MLINILLSMFALSFATAVFCFVFVLLGRFVKSKSKMSEYSDMEAGARIVLYCATIISITAMLIIGLQALNLGVVHW